LTIYRVYLFIDKNRNVSKNALSSLYIRKKLRYNNIESKRRANRVFSAEIAHCDSILIQYVIINPETDIVNLFQGKFYKIF